MSPRRHRPLQVSLRDVTVTRRVPQRQDAVPSLPANVGATLRHLLLPLSTAGTRELQVLSRVTASFRAGTATLVLGSPGSGKSTLLRALSGRLEGTAPQGAVLYNGEPADVLRSRRGVNLCRLAAYAPQVDVHQTFLTVRELFAFAHESCAAALPAGASGA